VIHPLVVDLGFDLGTTVTKLTALAEDGTKLVDLSVATTWDELGDGCAERNPRAVVAAVEDLLERAATTVGGPPPARPRRPSGRRSPWGPTGPGPWGPPQ